MDQASRKDGGVNDKKIWKKIHNLFKSIIITFYGDNTKNVEYCIMSINTD